VTAALPGRYRLPTSRMHRSWLMIGWGFTRCDVKEAIAA
jgi:hypothetical protein